MIVILLLYLNLFRSISEDTGKTLSREQSPMSRASHELHKKYHFSSVCKSCTMMLPTYLEKQKKYLVNIEMTLTDMKV